VPRAPGLGQRPLRLARSRTQRAGHGDAVLTERIRQVHADSHYTCGMPRARAELIDQGVTVSRKRVAGPMREHAIRGISRRRGFTITTRCDKGQRPAPDLVRRRFEADGPNR